MVADGADAIAEGTDPAVTAETVHASGSVVDGEQVTDVKIGDAVSHEDEPPRTLGEQDREMCCLRV